MILLRPRTEETVRIYFDKVQHPFIRQMLPQKAVTVEEAVADFVMTQQPGATSCGRTVWLDDRYVGDVWIYAIDPSDTPNAMLSYCIFEQDIWGKGAATEAVRLFLQEMTECYGLNTVGAFTYSVNAASIRVLEKNGFIMAEEFSEDGVASCYFQWTEGGYPNKSLDNPSQM